MRRLVIMGLMLAVAGSAALAQDQLVSMDAKRARVYRATDSALTGPSSATPAVVVGRFLRERGQSAATVASLREVAQYRSPVTGLTHIRMEQEVAGMRVADAYVKAALNRQGELVHLIQNLAVVKPGVAAARATERQALRAALAHLYPGSKEDPAVVGRQGNITTFARSPTFYAAPTVERVALLMSSGALKTGFLVETWKDRGNLLHNTLVDGSGRVLATELRTNTDSYNIFPDHPGNSTQTVVAGPGAGNAESPSGWLFAGTHSSIHIAGNNASAYLDRDNDNAPDPGGDPISTGDFLSVADLGTAPTTATNQNVAVQNLFYMNNLTHDILYRHGFVEGAGNFQENNFGMGGRGGDPVNAEAQDGGGTDNANFATPRDGRNPRMQMYLWTGRGIDQVVVGATTYMAEGAAFGPPLTPGGITAVIVEVSDGTGTLTDGCEAFSGVSGQIALIDRGTCSFVTKVRNAQTAGALAVIVANNVATSPFTMGDDGTGGDITIPAVMVSQADGLAIKVGLPGSGTVRQTTPPPLQIDGDLDSDIIYHEYGHGLTWRMVGRMSGSLSGAIGEGMSDVLSVLFNEDDAVGEYSFSDPIGIRTARYTGYPRTYGDIVGTEVHLDGEVYGAIGWRLFENFQAAGVPKDTLLDYLVDGMNYTPAGPSFEEMRDGILQSVANSGNPHACLVWDAFADYGVGVGAQGRTRGANVLVTESFVLPPECAGP